MATAMATILSYWKYPERGTGCHSYTSETYGFPCSFDFANTTFDWETILPAYVEGEYTDEQAEAIATLMYACGVAVDMDYGPESGAFEVNLLAGLVGYFGINPYAQLPSRSMYSTQEWMEMVCSELSARRPIYYIGADKEYAGHAFVLDGYDRNGMGMSIGAGAARATAISTLRRSNRMNWVSGAAAAQGMPSLN